jgi:hypothetical protein
VGILLFLFVLGAALAACGSTSPHPNAFVHCGTVRVTAGRVQPADAAAARAAENCFAHNYTSCQASVLAYTDMGVDTSTTHDLAESAFNGKCAVTDQVQRSIAPGGGTPFPAQTYTCAAVQQQADGLHVTGCGQEGTVLVPAPPAG